MTTRRARKPKVLVVEDDTPVRRSLQLLLSAQGFSVRAHGSAAQALADPEARSADCLVADLVMNEVDGLDLLDALRKDGWLGPAILISAHLTPECSRSASAAGYATILPKPLVEGMLIEAVAKALEADRACLQPPPSR